MTVAAILMVRDEADLIEHTLRHLQTQVDGIVVADNLSSDGTTEILARFEKESRGDFFVYDDDDPAYYQARKMTGLAEKARALGFDWGLFVDADEMWVTEPNGRPIREHLLSLPPDVQAVRARVFHYIPTADDPDDDNPFRRIGWRLAAASSLPKMGARLVEGLEVEAGNHGVTIDGERPRLVAGGLRVNHYSWRSPAQYGRKIRNGARAYAATDLPEEVGVHWRMWGDPESPDLEERAAAHFRRYFWAAKPPFPPGSEDELGLVYDPAVSDE